MNSAVKMNLSFSRQFLAVGIAILAVTSALFIFKSIRGYNKVEFAGKFDNCTVQTERIEKRRKNRHSSAFRSRYYYCYYVTVTNKEMDYQKKFSCGKDYYYGFMELESFNGITLSFYKTEDGIIFPVYEKNCNERRAERELRNIYPPNGWYILYAAGCIIGLGLVSLGIKSRQAARRYAADKTCGPIWLNKERQDMLNELDMLIKNDKYGRYKNHKYK